MSLMRNPLSEIGGWLLRIGVVAGEAVVLGGAVLRHLSALARGRKRLFYAIDRAGFGSLLVVSLIAALTGMIMVLQIAPTLVRYGVEQDTLGGIIATTFTRELGPLWAAVIVLARTGSAMTAELGTMKVNEEVDALEVMGIHPVRYLIVPRVVGLVLAMPLLTAVADIVGLLGAALVASLQFHVDWGAFSSSIQGMISLGDVWGGLLKGTIFGAVIALIACASGLRVSGGAEAVGRATTDTVRTAIVAILVADLLLTRFLLVLGVTNG